MRFIRAFYRLFVASIMLLVFFGFMIEEFTLEDVETIDVIVYSLFILIFFGYLIYQYIFCAFDFLSKHHRYIWLWGFASIFPVILLIVMVFYTEDFGSELIELTFIGFSISLVAMHIFDFFYYRKPLPDLLTGSDEIIDF